MEASYTLDNPSPLATTLTFAATTTTTTTTSNFAT